MREPRYGVIQHPSRLDSNRRRGQDRHFWALSMSKWNIMIAAVVIAGLIGFFTVGEPPFVGSEPVAQLVSGPPPKPVTPEELDLYLSVYKAMQADRDLDIDEAIEPHGMALREFRDIERRIQMRSTLVERVRRDLLAHAAEISIFSPSAAPVATDTASD